MGEFVRIDMGSGSAAAVATIRLDRPPMNALNAAVQEELR
ncbi:MAG: enoyl-CoA hydratase/isomerase family protein, partial [Frankiaceae bacterium]